MFPCWGLLHVTNVRRVGIIIIVNDLRCVLPVVKLFRSLFTQAFANDASSHRNPRQFACRHRRNHHHHRNHHRPQRNRGCASRILHPCRNHHSPFHNHRSGGHIPYPCDHHRASSQLYMSTRVRDRLSVRAYANLRPKVPNRPPHPTPPPRLPTPPPPPVLALQPT